MKKLLAMLLALTLAAVLPAMAETVEIPAPEEASPLAPFELAIPDAWQVELNGASVTFVSGNTRVVAMVISRVGDVEADHQASLATLMSQFSPEAEEPAPMVLNDGFYGLLTVAFDVLEGAGEGNLVDQLTVMVLHQPDMQGHLLILSGYDMNGDNAAVQAMLDTLLTTAAVDGTPILPPPEAEAALPLG